MDQTENALEFLSRRLLVRDLTAEARSGLVAEFVQPASHASGSENGKIDQFEAAARVLFRKDCRHLLVTGQKGVGKTSYVVELARLAAIGKYQFLRDHRFLWFDTTHVGPEDSRGCLESILLVAHGIHPVVLCLDGIHSLLRRSEGGSNKPLLRAALQNREISVVGVLPRWEFGELFAADAEMLELFDRLEIEECDEGSGVAIVESAAQRLANQYCLPISSQAVRRAVFLTSNFMLSEQLPSKAVKVLRQACDDVSFARDELALQRHSVEASDVVRVVAEKSGIPQETLDGQITDANWEAALSLTVVGQPRAVRCVADELRVIKAGLTDPGKPASVLLFAGMTGVGKTELAKRLAELYSSSRRLQNYSMANFTESHSVSGIVGVPPGYVGHDQGGRLINDLNSDPYSVFLLDEAEKAHPNVWKPFLNLFDEGWIVDQRGVKASADRAIFVLTTNAGSEEVQQMSRDNRPIEEIEQRVVSILARVRQERGSQPVFPPQFLARLKQIVVFQPLDANAMRLIAQKLIHDVQSRWLRRREQRLEIAPVLINWIGDQAQVVSERSGGREGGRAVRKLITSCIEGKLAELVSQSTSAGNAGRTLRLSLEVDLARNYEADISNANPPILVEYC